MDCMRSTVQFLKQGMPDVAIGKSGKKRQDDCHSGITNCASTAQNRNRDDFRLVLHMCHGKPATVYNHCSHYRPSPHRGQCTEFQLCSMTDNITLDSFSLASMEMVLMAM